MAGSSLGTGTGNRLLIHCWISSQEDIINERPPSELERLASNVAAMSGAVSSSRRSSKFVKKMFETRTKTDLLSCPSVKSFIGRTTSGRRGARVGEGESEREMGNGRDMGRIRVQQ